MSRIALVQMTTTDGFEANLAHALTQVERAAQLGARLVAFPEVFLYIGGKEGKFAHAQEVEGPVVARFRELAARHRMLVLLGSVYERIPGRQDKVFNTSILLDGEGRTAGVYRKLKLFDVELPQLRIMESDTIAAGDALPPVIGTPIGRVGLTICFDIRFPVLYQHLREQGAEIVFVPSNFTFPTGAAHWELLLRCRALETQVYLAAPAQVGQHNPKYASYGHAALVDPWGNVTAQASNQPALVVGEVDLAYLAAVRRNMPLGFAG
ncbi:MAG: carbon-nitrogen hydrolase family protein [Candidatus Lambdaproteobacteria bacterium]|nr:carbon-nitrogen hydrolase family protein [Candidatus Lambdaproteobacteria bacterium]